MRGLSALLLAISLGACAPSTRPSTCGAACAPAKAIVNAPAELWGKELLIAFAIALAICVAL